MILRRRLHDPVGSWTQLTVTLDGVGKKMSLSTAFKSGNRVGSGVLGDGQSSEITVTSSAAPGSEREISALGIGVKGKRVGS